MPINLNGLTRPVNVTTQVLNPVITAGTPIVLDSVGVGEESFLFPISYPSTDPPSFPIAGCSAASGATTLTTTGSFANVRVGDAVSGTGIGGSPTVTAKAANNLSLTLSAATTAIIAAASITFDPPASAPLFHAIKLTYTKSGNTLLITPQILLYDGTGAVPAPINLVRQVGGAIVQDVDAFLNNFRVPRS